MSAPSHRAAGEPLADEAIRDLMRETPEWDLVREEGVEKLRRTFSFRNFAQALEFTNRVGEVAEEQGHHPIIVLTWGKATVTWYSHDVGGLQHKDFAMAARTDELYTAA